MKEVKEMIEKLVLEALASLGAKNVKVVIEHPERTDFGDYSTNVGIITGRAEDIREFLDKHRPKEIERVEVRGGFINFFLSKDFFKESLGEIIKEGKNFGKNKNLKGQKVIVEYTDPNPFKEFHIGHLMSNAIGESVSRLVEWSGAEVKRACYQGDVGMHVAKAVWAIKYGHVEHPYVVGNQIYERDESAKAEIQEINKKIYDQSDKEINKIYNEGRKESLKSFDVIYKKLGTHFDIFLFESESWPIGFELVKKNIGKIFELGDEGAIVFRGEKRDAKLHTRVFVTKEGLPTYEAKELGLFELKWEKFNYDKSIVITGNEVNEYFRVVLKVTEEILPKLSGKTEHLSHGMLRLPTGKMSSRTGDIITAEELIEEVKEKTQNEEVAVGAIKYMILRQALGNDIVFDIERSVSTEGDSGVYLQYARARAGSLLAKANKKGNVKGEQGNVREVEKLLYRFPEIVERAAKSYEPHHLTTYLTELSSTFNNFYAHEHVISEDSESDYRLAIVEAFKVVMDNGLNILGIPAPEEM